MIRTKTETEDLLFLRTKNCETPIKQTRGKSEETLENKLTKSRGTLFFQTHPYRLMELG